MQKVSTDSVVMTPNTTTTIGLDELNKIIAEQKGVSIDDLAVKPDTATTTATAQTARNTEALTDDQLAAQMRSQADRFYKEAARLRKEAETLSPKKKSLSKNTCLLWSSLLKKDCLRRWWHIGRRSFPTFMWSLSL